MEVEDNHVTTNCLSSIATDALTNAKYSFEEEKLQGFEASNG